MVSNLSKFNKKDTRTASFDMNTQLLDVVVALLVPLFLMLTLS